MENRGRPQVAIVGRPNVGKSALFNRLAGRQIAIVHDQPGLTRDRISAPSPRGDFIIWDTGGIGGAGESELVEEVRHAAETAMRDSDLILFLVDAKAGLTPVDQDLARTLRRSQRPVLLVVNKVDDAKHENLEADFQRLGFDTFAISAAHDRGIDSLVKAIEHRFPQSGLRTPYSAAPPAVLPLSLAIIGRPNVGKSSLINAILSDRRTIVSELPGTTRDAVDVAYRRGEEEFLLIDTAGIRPRGKRSSSVEVFSVMRSERTIRRADLCVLVIDATAGVTAQDKKIAALMQKAHKPSLVIVNKWDLVKLAVGRVRPIRHRTDSSNRRTDGRVRRRKETLARVIEDTRARLFFLPYAPVLVASALTGENVDRLFKEIHRMQRAGRERIGTGVLNRLLGQAFAANPPPMVSNRRLKLFYSTQTRAERASALVTPEFVLFVNDPDLITDTYARYLEAQIRVEKPFVGLPLMLNFRPRSDTSAAQRKR